MCAMAYPQPHAKKTSLSQLLNPISTSPRNDQYENPSNSPVYSHHPPPSGPSSAEQQLNSPRTSQDRPPPQFSLRAADWNNVPVNFRRGLDDAQEDRGVPGRYAEYNPSHLAWPAPHPVADARYRPAGASPMYPDERKSLSGNQYIQGADRASLRIASRSTSDVYQHPYPHQEVSSYPPPPPLAAPPPEQSSKRVRKEFEDDANSQAGPAAPPKQKKARKSSTPSEPSTTKKSYKKRNDPVQVATNAPPMMQAISYPQNGKGKEVMHGPGAPGPQGDFRGDEPSKLVVEVQFARCMSNRYRTDTFPRCVSCTRRWAGDTCRFQGIRYFVRDSKRVLVAVSFVESQKGDTPTFTYPNRWNIPFEEHHYRRIMKTVAVSLLPHLKREQEHVKHHEVIRRPRETDVRATCDTCMTSLFSNSWMCRQCGRESCPDCFAIVRDLTGDTRNINPNDMSAIQMKRDKYAQSNPFFLSCTKRNEHDVTLFSPVSRFCESELKEAIKEMEILVTEPEEVVEKPPKPPSVAASNLIDDPYPEWVTLEDPIKPACVPTHKFSPPVRRMMTFEDGYITEEQFGEIWTRGEPLVVKDISHRFRMPWTPEDFIKRYRTTGCLIVECSKDVNKKVSVEDFFSLYGKYTERPADECWKLKDWPPSADFKFTFPDHFEDFSRAVPVPSYTRRNGAMNIASHFPSNTIAPDLGPKMYNALASAEDAISKGTTRLHMDMADAVNVMLYSEKTRTGEDGFAVWDIYRADDADVIRRFLRKVFRGKFHNDPIHSQQFYLDNELKAKLYEQHNVRGWRFYQRPGDAVFIPAGCAHQVCNYADCMKIACDFVSPENVARCERLTREFRDQNQALVWKEDVLQLRTMMWFAWLSCRRYKEKNKK